MNCQHTCVRCCEHDFDETWFCIKCGISRKEVEDMK